MTSCVLCLVHSYTLQYIKLNIFIKKTLIPPFPCRVLSGGERRLNWSLLYHIWGTYKLLFPLSTHSLLNMECLNFVCEETIIDATHKEKKRWNIWSRLPFCDCIQPLLLLKHFHELFIIHTAQKLLLLNISLLLLLLLMLNVKDKK